ncbi:MAG: flippase-like domain-containing protein [Chloroflexi bacterium]|nr:flippase-like domain-containing protein [Chloroflexota bacterium]
MSDFRLASVLNRRHWWWQISIGLAIAVGLLVLLLHKIDGRATVQALSRAQPLWVGAALLSVLLNDITKTFRWRLLFPADQPTPSRRQTFGILMAGQLVNMVLPFRSGDVFRAYFMGRDRGASTAATFGTIGAEKLIDLILLGLVAAFILPLIVLPSSVHTSPVQMLALAVGVSLVWAALILALPHLDRLLLNLGQRFPLCARWADLLHRLLQGLTALREWRKLPQLLAWSGAVWGTAILTNMLLFQAFGMTPSLLYAALVLLFIYGGVSIPMAPGQLGVFEALTVVALRLVGIEPVMALAYALLLHALVLVVPMLFGSVWLFRRTRRLG